MSPANVPLPSSAVGTPKPQTPAVSREAQVAAGIPLPSSATATPAPGRGDSLLRRAAANVVAAKEDAPAKPAAVEEENKVNQVPAATRPNVPNETGQASAVPASHGRTVTADHKPDMANGSANVVSTASMPSTSNPQHPQETAQSSNAESTSSTRKRYSVTSPKDHSQLVELPATKMGDDDDEPVMKATSYPGDEWIPRWEPE